MANQLDYERKRVQISQIKFFVGDTQWKAFKRPSQKISMNGAKAFLAAHLSARAEEAAQVLLDPRNGMQESPLAARLKKAMEAAV